MIDVPVDTRVLKMSSMWPHGMFVLFKLIISSKTLSCLHQNANTVKSLSMWANQQESCIEINICVRYVESKQDSTFTYHSG